MTFIPNFNKYYKNNWNYSKDDGVGVKLSGYPNNLDKFISLLQSENCNPIATRRILSDLKQEGVKYTTLMSHLNFNYIGDTLFSIGTIMEIIPPIISNKSQNKEFDHLAFAIYNKQQKFEYIQLNDFDKQEIQNRLNIFLRSLNEYSHNLEKAITYEH